MSTPFEAPRMQRVGAASTKVGAGLASALQFAGRPGRGWYLNKELGGVYQRPLTVWR